MKDTDIRMHSSTTARSNLPAQATFITNWSSQQCYFHKQLTSTAVPYPHEIYQHRSAVPTTNLPTQLCHTHKQLCSTTVPYPQTPYQHTTTKFTSNSAVQHCHIHRQFISTAVPYPWATYQHNRTMATAKVITGTGWLEQNSPWA
jgi:hypothetical protein